MMRRTEELAVQFNSLLYDYKHAVIAQVTQTGGGMGSAEVIASMRKAEVRTAIQQGRIEGFMEAVFAMMRSGE